MDELSQPGCLRFRVFDDQRISQSRFPLLGIYSQRFWLRERHWSGKDMQHYRFSRWV
jgi:hypothetical protein